MVSDVERAGKGEKKWLLRPGSRGVLSRLLEVTAAWTVGRLFTSRPKCNLRLAVGDHTSISHKNLRWLAIGVPFRFSDRSPTFGGGYRGASSPSLFLLLPNTRRHYCL